jgi:hypothetical protein
MRNITRALALSSVILGGLGGCSSSPSQGTERGDCYPNGTCNAGLVCLSGVCVKPSAADSARPDSSRADTLALDMTPPAIDMRTLDAPAADTLLHDTQSPDTLPSPLTPVAPGASDFMWQNLQTEFDRGGTRCTADVSMAVGSGAVCYVANGGSLFCKGTFGGFNSPTYAGAASNVDQVMAGSSSNEICVHRTDHTVWCEGDNPSGEFGSGSKGATTSFVQFGTSNTLAHFATGTFDQLCVIDGLGAVSCAGAIFGANPVSEGTAAAGKLWVNVANAAKLDDATVYRAAEARTECQLGAGGLHCNSGPSFTGNIVDGGYTRAVPGECLGASYFGQDVVYLDSTGHATRSSMVGNCPCFRVSTPIFTQQSVLLLGYDYYSSTVCAVYEDGSLWCSNGPNVGVATDGGVSIPETQEQPPGSVQVFCR